MAPDLEINGFKLFEKFLPSDAQREIVAALREVALRAPFRQPEMPSGHKMSVQMSAAGPYGWLADASGYRYASHQPDGEAWPDIPARVLKVWEDVTDTFRLPDSCLINFYGENAKLGLHQDKDEVDATWPVVSISLGDDALFRMGGQDRGDKTRSVWLRSGDVVVLSGSSRLAYHGIDRIKFGTSPLLPKGGRINVTLRVSQ